MSHVIAKKKPGGTRKLQNPWEAAQSTVLIRHDAETSQDTPLEPGVNFFVLMLEQLGATTRFSCEGHPEGFYVVFESSPELARAITHAGFFTLEIWEGEADYAMRISEHLFEKYVGPWNDAARKAHLRLAALRWTERFGPLPEDASANWLLKGGEEPSGQRAP